MNRGNREKKKEEKERKNKASREEGEERREGKRREVSKQEKRNIDIPLCNKNNWCESSSGKMEEIYFSLFLLLSTAKPPAYYIQNKK